MKIETKQEILEVLRMPFEEYRHTVMAEAARIHREENGNILTATAMLGYDNICKNQCLYCGMRAGNSAVKRYRLDQEEVIRWIGVAQAKGFGRLFLVSGEDPKYGFDHLLAIVNAAKNAGMHVSLACGEFSLEQYRELKNAGADEYVMKFEMSDREDFDRLNPSTSFEKRIKNIGYIKQCGLKLASGNIVGYPGHNDSKAADDILLMKELEISWAPVIPYMPALNTPLAKEGGPGSIETNLKEISILRIMMHSLDITAQQPGRNLAQGLASTEGNLEALKAGANMLFADMLPDAMAKNFSVVDNRSGMGMAHLEEMAKLSGMELKLRAN